MITVLLAVAQAAQESPSGPTAFDRVFAYGTLALLVGLIVWNARQQGPPKV